MGYLNHEMMGYSLFKKLVTFVLFCEVGLFSLPVFIFAQSPVQNPDQAAKPPAISEELIGEEEDDIDRELSYSSAELRERAYAGMGLAVGSTDAWQNVTFSYLRYYKPWLAFQGVAGGGGYRFSDSKSGRDYRLKIEAKTLNGGVRVYLWRRLPIYTQTSLGYSFWKADSVPTGVLDRSDPELEGRLRYSGNLHGVWLGQQLGFEMIWGSGVAIEFSLAGIAKSFVLGDDFTTAHSGSKKIVREKIQAPLSWGLLNFKLAYIFLD